MTSKVAAELAIYASKQYPDKSWVWIANKLKEPQQ